MKDKKSKKVVIINDIQSETIEKAIFILRNSGTPCPAPHGYRIVEEAQDIIHAYRQTLEKSQSHIDRRERRSRRNAGRTKAQRILCASCALLGFFIFASICLSVIEPFLEKF